MILILPSFDSNMIYMTFIWFTNSGKIAKSNHSCISNKSTKWCRTVHHLQKCFCNYIEHTTIVWALTEIREGRKDQQGSKQISHSMDRQVASSLYPPMCLTPLGRPVQFHDSPAVLTYTRQDEHVKTIFSHNKSNSFRTQVFRVEKASILIKASARSIKQTRKIFKGFLNEKKHMGSN